MSTTSDRPDAPLVSAGESLADLRSLVLTDPDGRPVSLASLAGPVLVVQLVRYFGCLPCQERLVDLDRAADKLSKHGARAVAVGGSADYQARWLADHHHVTMPLLIDADQQMRTSVAVGDLGARLADPRGLVSYGRSLTHGYRPQRMTRDTLRAPGVVILDAELRRQWAHMGRRIGDYPELSEVVDAAARVAGSKR